MIQRVKVKDLGESSPQAVAEQKEWHRVWYTAARTKSYGKDRFSSLDGFSQHAEIACCMCINHARWMLVTREAVTREGLLFAVDFELVFYPPPISFLIMIRLSAKEVEGPPSRDE